jgi:general secretion pathway protein D
VVVENGQTIALGGFIRESEDFQRDRIPIIGQIPVMGALFGSTTKSKVRSELIILITPHVLGNRADADQATQELKSKVQKIQELMNLP